MQNKPLLSVCLLTYNHAPYIAQAIEGVLMQKADFNWNFIISDDNSNDGTSAILQSYQNKYPELITLILNEKNLGAYQHWVNLLATPTSKYIAYFEGDDYWTDPTKLQKQVDFLEANPSYSFIGHHVKLLNQHTGELSDYATYADNPIRLKDTVFGPPFHTSSFVARNGMGIPTGLKNLPAGDDAIICHWASQGLGYAIPEFMSVYRVSNSGTWSSLSQTEKDARALVIHIWIFRRFKPIFFSQAKLIGKELLSLLKRKPAKLKRFTFSDWLLLLFPILIASVTFSKKITAKWLKK